MLPLLIKSTLRLILRNQTLSLIKIVGLGLGLSAFILTSLFSIHEYSFDKNHQDYERIYRVVHQVQRPEGFQRYAFISAPTGPALKDRFPEIENFARIVVTNVNIRNNKADITFNELRFAFADPSLFDLFNLPVAGERFGNALLRDPYELILTPETASKYFGKTDPVGRTLIINGKMECVVKGVLLNNLNQTHLDFDFVASFSTLEAIRNNPSLASQFPESLNLETKGYNAFYTYVKLAKGASVSDLIAKLPAFVEDFRGKGKSEILKPTLQNLSSIHLHSNLLYEMKDNGSTQAIAVFFSVGLLILVIACINYTNISMAEFSKRGRSVSLKKILGVNRSALLWNHFGETVGLVLVSTGLGTILAYSFLPVFNDLVGRQIKFFGYDLLVIVAMVFLFTSVFSGLYPAFSISRVSSLDSFKSALPSSKGSMYFRNSLVFFQFFISFSLISISILIYNQMDFLLKKDLGFQADQVMVINTTGVPKSAIANLKTAVLNKAGIVAISECSSPPGNALSQVGVTLPENESNIDARIGMYQSYVDADYLHALGLRLTTGRFFDPSSPSDSLEYVIVNEAGAKVLGNNILNHTINVPDIFGNGINKKSVIGIISDFHFASFYHEIEPLILEYNPKRANYLMVKFETSNTSELIKGVSTQWKELGVISPFDYYFMDQGFAKLYDSEQKQKNLVAIFAILAAALASLGLFGTTLFLVQQKTKEVGIRKVLGSGDSGLLGLLLRPILILLCFACAAGIPFSLMAGSEWLAQYAYKIKFSPLIFIGSFSLIFLVVTITMIYHFLNVLKINPAQVLRQS